MDFQLKEAEMKLKYLANAFSLFLLGVLRKHVLSNHLLLEVVLNKLKTSLQKDKEVVVCLENSLLIGFEKYIYKV